MLQNLLARYICGALVQQVLFCMFQARAKGRGRKRPTQLIVDDTDAVQIRGTVSPTSFHTPCKPVNGNCYMDLMQFQVLSNTLR